MVLQSWLLDQLVAGCLGQMIEVLLIDRDDLNGLTGRKSFRAFDNQQHTGLQIAVVG